MAKDLISDHKDMLLVLVELWHSRRVRQSAAC